MEIDRLRDEADLGRGSVGVARQGYALGKQAVRSRATAARESHTRLTVPSTVTVRSAYEGIDRRAAARSRWTRVARWFRLPKNDFLTNQTFMPDPALALVVFGIAVATTAAVIWPRIGLAPRLRRLLRLSERVLLEDAVKHIYTCGRTGRVCSLESLAGRLAVSRARAAALLSRLAAMGLVHTGGAGPILTDEGRQSALRLVRTHRMWERYLADRTGVPASEWHDEAERMEHALSVAEVDALDTRLGHPRWDPHGDPIPTPAGDIPPDQGLGLVSAEAGRTVEILHLEDEPREIYDALTRDGLLLGGRLDIVARTDSSIRVRSAGREWEIDIVAAGNVTVRYLPVGERAETSRTTLLDAAPGETVHVTAISRACQGTQRRRLLDLGVVRGTPITPELASAAGDPVAYRIRGALIALRRTQAVWIHVERAAARGAEAAPHAVEEVA